MPEKKNKRKNSNGSGLLNKLNSNRTTLAKINLQLTEIKTIVKNSNAKIQKLDDLSKKLEQQHLDIENELNK